jgi:hypothetical protein
MRFSNSARGTITIGGLNCRGRPGREVAWAASLLAAASVGIGCVLPPPTPASVPPSQSVTSAAGSSPSQHVAAPQRALPFRGKLVEGNPDELPPAVAAALSTNTPITFAYREQLTHDEYHIPLMLSALDPVTYAGAPLGDYGVTAFASLTVRQGDTVLGAYTAKAHVSKSYSLYAEPTHRELEQAARTEVRDKIDQRLDRDADRIAGIIDHAADHKTEHPGDLPAQPAPEPPVR